MIHTKVVMAANGRVVIPAQIRAELGLIGGENLVVRLVEGTVVLEPLEAAIRRAQRLVSEHVPPGAPLVDELLAERRAAAANE